MYANVTARVPDAILRDIRYVAREENSDKSKIVRELLSEGTKSKLLNLSLKKYSRREVSLGRAAELAKIPLADFMVKAAERKIPLNYYVDSVKKDFKAALKAK